MRFRLEKKEQRCSRPVHRSCACCGPESCGFAGRMVLVNLARLWYINLSNQDWLLGLKRPVISLAWAPNKGLRWPSSFSWNPKMVFISGLGFRNPTYLYGFWKESTDSLRELADLDRPLTHPCLGPNMGL